MIVMHERGRITQVMTVYPPDYAKRLNANGKSFVAPGQKQLQALRGVSVVQDYYVRRNRLVERPTAVVPGKQSMAIGEVMKFPDLPACRVTFDDQSEDVAAGELEFAADAAGVYSLFIECWPMKNFNTEITVT